MFKKDIIERNKNINAIFRTELFNLYILYIIYLFYFYVFENGLLYYSFLNNLKKREFFIASFGDRFFNLAFFISSFMISIFCYFFIGYDTNFQIIMLASLITTIVELYSIKLKIDDNLAIPLTYAFFTFFLGFII